MAKPFTDDDLTSLKRNFILIGVYGRWITPVGKVKALVKRLEAAERIIERMSESHYEDCSEITDLGKCDCGSADAMRRWNKACGRE